MATSTASQGAAGSSNEGTEQENKNFECNICLDTAKDAVVSMCGHLFWWVSSRKYVIDFVYVFDWSENNTHIDCQCVTLTWASDDWWSVGIHQMVRCTFACTCDPTHFTFHVPSTCNILPCFGKYVSFIYLTCTWYQTAQSYLSCTLSIWSNTKPDLGWPYHQVDRQSKNGSPKLPNDKFYVGEISVRTKYWLFGQMAKKCDFPSLRLIY